MTKISWITDYLAIGPRLELGSVKISGVQTVIDLNSDPQEADDAKLVGIEYHSCRLTDESSRELWLMGLDRISRILRESRKNGKRVFLHCTHGVGRSPTAAIAYLTDESYSLNDAIELVKKKHPETWGPGNPVGKYKAILGDYQLLKAKSVSRPQMKK